MRFGSEIVPGFTPMAYEGVWHMDTSEKRLTIKTECVREIVSHPIITQLGWAHQW